MRRKMLRMFLVAGLAAMPYAASAQKASDPEGHLTYSLPSTTIRLDVEAVQEVFHAGPYARYAEKYLGVKARQKDETSCHIVQVSMTPLVEADLSRRYALAVKKSALDATFLKLSSAGLVSFSDGIFGEMTRWRFPKAGEADFSGMGVSSNLTSESATLYRNEKKESAYSRVGVQQNMVVEKTLEQKASEAAQMIIRLREHRLQIVTGDTDATYSGEAMAAAINELSSLEKEYMALFVGYTDYNVQNMSFDVIPSAGRESQMYVAFRVSDTAGLVPADNLSGKPVVMEVAVPEVAVPEVSEKKDVKGPVVNYLIPATCTVKVKDGNNLLVQGRVPVYQLGVLSTMPLNTTLQ